jgi:hypothetical protein
MAQQSCETKLPVQSGAAIIKIKIKAQIQLDSTVTGLQLLENKCSSIPMKFCKKLEKNIIFSKKNKKIFSLRKIAQ